MRNAEWELANQRMSGWLDEWMSGADVLRSGVAMRRKLLGQKQIQNRRSRRGIVVCAISHLNLLIVSGFEIRISDLHTAPPRQTAYVSGQLNTGQSPMNIEYSRRY